MSGRQEILRIRGERVMRIDIKGDKITIYEGGKKVSELFLSMLVAIKGPLEMGERLERWGYTHIEPINS